MLKRMFKLLALLAGIIVLIVVGMLGYITVTDYKPKLEEQLTIRHPQYKVIEAHKPITITTMNIGYAGLDANQDFFMDGGKSSRASSQEQVDLNLQATIELLAELQSDIYLLQEVDVEASRSYHLNQVEQITSNFSEHSSVFAYNYKTPWVPVPITSPMGKVESGLLSLSKHQIDRQTRFDLPGKEEWPIQLFELDRSIVEHRLPIDNGKELVVLNVHLSAFDAGGTIRQQQLQYLQQYIEREMQNDSYLIIGGDWNHALPGSESLTSLSTQPWPDWLQELPDSFKPEGFSWAVSSNTPTVRTLDIPYEPGTNFVAIVDGFLVSDNIEVVEVHTSDNQFTSSDHHAVTATFRFKP